MKREDEPGWSTKHRVLYVRTCSIAFGMAMDIAGSWVGREVESERGGTGDEVIFILSC